MNVIPIPCLRDNYAYLLICPDTRKAAIVDPSEVEPVLECIQSHNVELVAILNTHHHWDHIGGNKGLLAHYGELAVYGHASDEGRIDGQTVFLNDGDTISFGNQRATVKHIPGHTTGAVAYCFDGDAFTGDTLFYGGCGRLFEGTPQMMYDSLVVRLAGELPPETRCWHGHEYTVSNLKYAAHAEPENDHIKERLRWAEKQRSAGEFTVPSTISDELLVNPFMRASSAEHLGRLRAEKDNF